MEESGKSVILKVMELESRIKNLEEKFSDEAWRTYAIRRASEDWSDADELFEF